MAEEEVLDEEQEPKKKSKGGLTVLPVIILVVIAIAITAIGTMMVTGKVDSIKDEVANSVNVLQQAAYTSEMVEGRQRLIAECQKVVQIKDKPLIINLADGASFLSVDIRICVEDSPSLNAELAAKLPIINYVCIEYLSTLTRADLFPKAGAKNVSGDEKDMMDVFGPASQNEKFSREMDMIRGELLNMLLARGVTLVKDVYFMEFLVQ